MDLLESLPLAKNIRLESRPLAENIRFEIRKSLENIWFEIRKFLCIEGESLELKTFENHWELIGYDS